MGKVELWAAFGCLSLVVLAMVPWQVVRLALQNCIRLDGSTSWRRVRRETIRLMRLVAGLLVMPVLAAVLVGSVVAVIHSYIVPLPVVHDVFRAYHSDPLVWEDNIEIGSLGDVGEDYEQWSQRKGFSPETARFWQELLWHNWMPAAIFALLIAVVLLWLFARYYVSLVRHYQKGIVQRRRMYDCRDHAPREALVPSSGGGHVRLSQDVTEAGIAADGSLWQPGTFSWTELRTPDAEAAKRFYTQLLGWTAEDISQGDTTYAVLQAGGKDIGGILEVPPRELTTGPHWGTYVTVADVDSTAKVAEHLDATILVPPTEIRNVGRFCMIQDPQGAVISVISYANA